MKCFLLEHSATCSNIVHILILNNWEKPNVEVGEARRVVTLDVVRKGGRERIDGLQFPSQRQLA